MSTTIVLINARVVVPDMDHVQTDMQLEIKGSRIHTIQPMAVAPPETPDPDRVVYDLQDATVYPGLTFAHTHIAYHNVVDTRDVLYKYDRPSLLQIASDNAERALRMGYTTMVGAGTVSGVDVELAGLIARQEVRGCELVPCSRDIMASGPIDRRNPETAKKIPSDLLRIADCVGDLEAFVEAEIAQGAKIIKVFSTGDDIFPNARSHEPLFTLEELQAVVRIARRHGVKVRAHSRGAVGIRHAIKAEVDIIDHATYASIDDLQEMTRQGQTLVPSFYQPRRLLASGLAHGKTQAFMDNLRYAAEVENTTRFLPHLEELGVNVALGDDFGFAWTPHGSYHQELIELRRHGGLSAPTVMKWATQGGARMLGREAHHGTVAPGKVADLMVLKDAPLHDLDCMSPANVVAVIKSGQLVAGNLTRRQGIASLDASRPLYSSIVAAASPR